MSRAFAIVATYAVAVTAAAAADVARADESTKAESPKVEAPQVYARPERTEFQRLGRGCEADFCRPRYAVTAALPVPRTLPDRYESTLTMMKGWIVGRSWHLRDDLALTLLQGDRYFTLTSQWLPTAALSLGPAFAGSGTVVGLRIPF